VVVLAVVVLLFTELEELVAELALEDDEIEGRDEVDEVEFEDAVGEDAEDEGVEDAELVTPPINWNCSL
jgi:hypothetical protein